MIAEMHIAESNDAVYFKVWQQLNKKHWIAFELGKYEICQLISKTSQKVWCQPRAETGCYTSIIAPKSWDT